MASIWKRAIPSLFHRLMATEASSWQAAAKLIDHTLLRPEATPEMVLQLCKEAVHFGFWAVMVNPCYVRLAKGAVEGSGVVVGTVVGFPLGANTTDTKKREAEEALRLGAGEIDMVINVGGLKSGDRIQVEEEIKAIVDIAHSHHSLVKVILETSLLTQSEKISACHLSVSAGADFVKTSTGFSSAGATVEDVELMRATVGLAVGVKAAGGVKTAGDLRAMVAAGATRIGTSASVAIMRELGALQ